MLSLRLITQNATFQSLYSFQPCPEKCHSGNVFSREIIMRLLLDILSKLIKLTKLFHTVVSSYTI